MGLAGDMCLEVDDWVIKELRLLVMCVCVCVCVSVCESR